MQTFLKVEVPEKTYELEIRQVGEKQVISMELADLLGMLGGKTAKASKARKISSFTKRAKKHILM